MKKSIYTILSAALFLFSCGEENREIIVPTLDTSSKHLQVAIYSAPDVYEEGFNHHTQQVEQIKLSYNRQVFVDLDAVSETKEATTLGVHYNDDAYVKLDVWDIDKDHATGVDGWDIVLSPYNGRTDNGSGTLVPYSLTGALTNKGNVTALRINKSEVESNGDTFISYDAINYENASRLELSSEVDAVGSDWKQLDFATFTYKIVEDQYYIIKTTEGVFFKLAFTSFYNDDLEKGHPALQFQRLIKEE
ncbi:HmuY family protein [Flavicella marina]|uniref:HmuY family protein n=1 Tax=Flavicella marina TaxID=1475951 RepID=UPI0012652064|nr:HmuY family protein [Flavicella marina]